ncbi:MAG: M23 family metallopeptidase [Anaerolineales bacterium]|nr:M23 family metallopeptidase [Anaerolineales bacterium]
MPIFNKIFLCLRIGFGLSGIGLFGLLGACQPIGFANSHQFNNHPTQIAIQTGFLSSKSLVVTTLPLLKPTLTATALPVQSSPPSLQVRATSPVPSFYLPDSEVVYSPSAMDFGVQAYLNQTSGFLKSHREYLKSTAWTSAAAILQRVATENSINPRLLLTLLEMNCACVSGDLPVAVQIDFLLGNTDFRRQGLFRQLSWAASRLSAGYYGWKAGQISSIAFEDGSQFPLDPSWNAGTVAVLYYFSFYGQEGITRAIDAESGVGATHRRLFGDFESRAATVEPLLPKGLTQPPFILPFEVGRMWAFTSGPHVVWETEGAMAALDFAPATYDHGCVPTDAWVTAVADGVVARSEFGAVVLDVDEVDGIPADGFEQSGWAVLYLHIAEEGRVTVGQQLKAGDRVGQPSCEGGRATGTHVHIARKYNGEWIPAAGTIPFELDGWIAQAGEKPYEGVLFKDGQEVIARPYGSYVTKIARPTFTPTPWRPSPPAPLP